MCCSEISHESLSLNYKTSTFGSNFFTLLQKGSAIHYSNSLLCTVLRKRKKKRHIGLGVLASILEHLVPCLRINDTQTQRDDKTKAI